MPKSIKQLQREAREKDMRELVNTYGADADSDDEVGSWNFNMMRLPGKGSKKGQHDDEIPDKLKGKFVFVSHKEYERGEFLRDDVLKFQSQKGSGIIYDDDETEIGEFFEEDGKRKYDFDYERLTRHGAESQAGWTTETIAQFDIEKSERESYKKRGGKKGIEATEKKEDEKEDKELQELKKQLQDSLKNDPNLPLQELRPAGGLWGEFIPPESKPTSVIPKPNPEQAEAIKNLRDINDIAVKDTSSNLKGDVNKLMSLYGIR